MCKLVVSVSFRHEIRSTFKKMNQINTVEKFEVFVVFDAFPVHFPNDFVLTFNTINSTTKRKNEPCITLTSTKTELMIQ